MFPSKRILPIAALCVVIIVIVIVGIAHYSKSIKTGNFLALIGITSQKSSTTGTQSATENQDWQKLLSEVSATSTASSTQPTTATESFTQNLIKQYIAAKASGSDISTDTEQSIIQNAVTAGDLSSYISQAVVYTSKDVKISSDNSNAALKKYADAVATALSSHPVPQGLNELNILDDVLNNNRTDELSSFDTISTSYKGILADLQKISTPKIAETIQIGFLNDFSQAANSVENMKKVTVDPIATMAAIQEYEIATPNLTNDMGTLKDLLLSNGVVFSQKDLGGEFYLVQDPTNAQTSSQ